MRALGRLKPVALLLLRWGLGLVFIFHGYPKLFTETDAYLQAFPRMGFPAYFAYVAGIVEFFGALLLFAGLFTRMAGLLLAGEMAIAIWKVHLGKGVLAVDQYEFPLALAVAAFALAATGAGAFSLDRVLLGEKD